MIKIENIKTDLLTGYKNIGFSYQFDDENIYSVYSTDKAKIDDLYNSLIMNNKIHVGNVYYDSLNVRKLNNMNAAQCIVKNVSLLEAPSKVNNEWKISSILKFEMTAAGKKSLSKKELIKKTKSFFDLNDEKAKNFLNSTTESLSCQMFIKYLFFKLSLANTKYAFINLPHYVLSDDSALREFKTRINNFNLKGKLLIIFSTNKEIAEESKKMINLDKVNSVNDFTTRCLLAEDSVVFETKKIQSLKVFFNGFKLFIKNDFLKYFFICLFMCFTFFMTDTLIMLEKYKVAVNELLEEITFIIFLIVDIFLLLCLFAVNYKNHVQNKKFSGTFTRYGINKSFMASYLPIINTAVVAIVAFFSILFSHLLFAAISTTDMSDSTSIFYAIFMLSVILISIFVPIVISIEPLFSKKVNKA